MTAPALSVPATASYRVSYRKATFDLIVVGSGAGGSMCAQQAAQAGLSVLVLEAGGHHLPSQMNQREGDMLPRLFYDAGGRSTQDGAVMILHGRGIGGSTVHNTNLCKRAPTEVLQQWATSHDCPSWSPERVAPDYEAVETELSVTPLTEEDVNRNNAIMRRGSKSSAGAADSTTQPPGLSAIRFLRAGLRLRCQGKRRQSRHPKGTPFRGQRHLRSARRPNSA